MAYWHYMAGTLVLVLVGSVYGGGGMLSSSSSTDVVAKDIAALRTEIVALRAEVQALGSLVTPRGGVDGAERHGDAAGGAGRVAVPREVPPWKVRFVARLDGHAAVMRALLEAMQGRRSPRRSQDPAQAEAAEHRREAQCPARCSNGRCSPGDASGDAALYPTSNG